ncbi:hypothetical protein DEO72_LG11g1163 [Vigna unguiculata]|uniref:Uncharacterized protein n=1 Tax=Vigna unguiculata TaxID=3917 RepID=A0A4D6NPK9_VIGUN|nr:hypothetical protein DEO72_LG11g1163 [Vigna unguiculata]
MRNVVRFHGHGKAFNAPSDLPKTVVRTMNQGSSPMSIGFHAVQQRLLVWDLSTCSMPFQVVLFSPLITKSS